MAASATPTASMTSSATSLAARNAARESGFTEPVEEIMVSAGSRQQLLRLLPERPGLFVCAVIDSRRGNLALTRYKLIEVRRALG